MTVLRDKGGFLSPVITLIDHEGCRAVLKDYRSKNSITRTLIAPALVRREFEALRRLEGVPGIPRALAVIDRRAIVTEFVDGRHLGKFGPGDLPDDAFRRLAATIREMHGRGVAHLDLRQRKNVLVDAAGRPWILDFGNAVIVKPASPLRALFPQLRAVDESALLKFKARTWPQLLSDRDRRALRRHRFLRRLWPFSPHTDRPGDLEGRRAKGGE